MFVRTSNGFLFCITCTNERQFTLFIKEYPISGMVGNLFLNKKFIPFADSLLVFSHHRPMLNAMFLEWLIICVTTTTYIVIYTKVFYIPYYVSKFQTKVSCCNESIKSLYLVICYMSHIGLLLFFYLLWNIDINLGFYFHFGQRFTQTIYLQNRFFLPFLPTAGLRNTNQFSPGISLANTSNSSVFQDSVLYVPLFRIRITWAQKAPPSLPTPSYFNAYSSPYTVPNIP